MPLKLLSIPVLALALADPAFADRRLPPEQAEKVAAVLEREGFSEWKEIELDDGLIAVDGALDVNGKRFELTLDPKSLAIVTRKAE